ncbi:hypothetical protein BC629DRAFT_1575871 [Irpex lacteus]|nr:hypothetical protein BC629DRAFT_1575871 [Irpex lacteus]
MIPIGTLYLAAIWAFALSTRAAVCAHALELDISRRNQDPSDTPSVMKCTSTQPKVSTPRERVVSQAVLKLTLSDWCVVSFFICSFSLVRLSLLLFPSPSPLALNLCSSCMTFPYLSLCLPSRIRPARCRPHVMPLLPEQPHNH